MFCVGFLKVVWVVHRTTGFLFYFSITIIYLACVCCDTLLFDVVGDDVSGFIFLVFDLLEKCR